MSYRDLYLKTSYETGLDDLVNDFYIPVLEQAKRYDRIAGFFSSSSLALAARGIAGLVKNNGTMRLITCPKLAPKDVEVIKSSVLDADIVLTKILQSELENIEEDFKNDHVAALGWMLANKKLEIRIALIYENGELLDEEKAQTSSIMHQKVGVLYDTEWNGISFSGSINESASGWLNNVEEFKVFCAWDNGQKPYFQSDQEKFERLWGKSHPSVVIKTLPEAVAEKLIEKGKDFDLKMIRQKYYPAHTDNGFVIKEKAKEKLNLFPYQKEAVEKWEANGRTLLLEMATGCGKTRTAIGCIKNVFESETRATLIIISCPGTTLSAQWERDIESLDIPLAKSIVCDGTNTGWRRKLDLFLKQMATGLYKRGIIYTTHQTCSEEDFINLISSYTIKIVTFFIGDEVHGMGADKTRNGLISFYKYRLGLSATPARWFDEEGTQLITEFFGNDSYAFTIHQAQTTINPLTGKPFLVNYYYHPRFVNLSDKELEDYKKLSDKIVKMCGSKDEQKQKAMQFLLFQRADIEKSAENKYEMLERILDEIGNDIDDTIIFVSPEQIDRVLQILATRKIIAHRFSEKESAAPTAKYGGVSERDYLITQFKNKRYNTLVAIKCLDEGIDIPSARRAIIMASSTNPREYIQRIGRVIRQDKDKPNAEIYDMIIRPNISAEVFNEQFKNMEKRIFLKEMDRVLDLSKDALNNVQVLKEMYKVKGAI